MVTKIRITRVYDDRLVEQIEPAMRRLGQAVGARMQRLVPKRTWALHDTIATTTERNGSKIATTIGFGSGDVDYGLHVERGTSKMRAQPFARPALLQTRAGDLDYGGKGITTHGVASASTRRSRMRDQR
jgi:HK97 gp10 family phage protein